MPYVAEQEVCRHCGLNYQYDQERRCWRCDGPACPDCVDSGPEPRCPECRFGPMPAHVEPMLATPGGLPANPHGWAFEFKWDGMRSLCYRQGDRVRLETRRLHDVTARYPDLLDDPRCPPPVDAIYDGEIVAMDDRGRPSFPMLQKRMHAPPARAWQAAARVPVSYFVFDLLWLNGQWLTDEPYEDRRARLAELRFDCPRWRAPEAHIGAGPVMLRTAERWGLEGLVAKRLGSPYRVGERGVDWIKLKLVKRQELVVGGWEPRRVDDQRIGSLLVGYYEPGSLGLRLAGRVGSGFDLATHERLVSMLRPLERSESPFTGPVGKGRPRFVWPRLVAEIAYRRWPRGGLLQQATFKGVRDDVAASEIVLGSEV